jgi:ribonuclease H / adenosylcobalamin/alpha-ribazole phosphatase
VHATIILIRHAAHAHLGQVLSGRVPGITLSQAGQEQARRLAQRLGGTRIDRLQSSPVQRAQETAAAIAAAQPGLSVESVAALDELDFGDWAGRRFAELSADPRWATWNADRASAVAPNGESMTEAQARAWAHVWATAQEHGGGTVAMISHCDIIRAVVSRVLGMSLDGVHRFEVDPASVTRLHVGPWGARLVSLNEGVHDQQTLA